MLACACARVHACTTAMPWYATPHHTMPHRMRTHARVQARTHARMHTSFTCVTRVHARTRTHRHAPAWAWAQTRMHVTRWAALDQKLATVTHLEHLGAHWAAGMQKLMTVTHFQDLGTCRSNVCFFFVFPFYFLLCYFIIFGSFNLCCLCPLLFSVYNVQKKQRNTIEKSKKLNEPKIMK